MRTCARIAQYHDADMAVVLRVRTSPSTGGCREPLENIASRVANIELGLFSAECYRWRFCRYLSWGMPTLGISQLTYTKSLVRELNDRTR